MATPTVCTGPITKSRRTTWTQRAKHFTEGEQILNTSAVPHAAASAARVPGWRGGAKQTLFLRRRRTANK